MANGLVKGHVYSVTALKRIRLRHELVVHFKTETIPMIRMRNPWGRTEWNGAWSDSSDEWFKNGYTERKNIGLTVEDDGEFWMSFRDWSLMLDVCHIFYNSFTSNHKKETSHYGRWTRQNPRYLFDVTKITDEVLITLQQEDQRIYKKTGQGKDVAIDFSVWKGTG
ncbi:calpain-5-like [Oryzias latipes]